MANRIIATFFLMICSIMCIQIKAAAPEQEREIVTVPEGVSLPLAFRALYNHASLMGGNGCAMGPHRTLSSNKHAMQVLLSRCDNLNCRYVDGKSIKVNFSAFYSPSPSPELDLAEYNKQHGNGRAQELLQRAAMAYPADHTVYSRDMCSYFEGVMRGEVDRGLLGVFDQCRAKDAPKE